MNSYLIPANSKKSLLKFGMFNTVDLVLLIIGVGITFGLMMILPINNFVVAIIALTPGVISAFLVFPIPNYHNVRTVIKNAIEFYTTRQKFIWKGWCFENGEASKE